MNAIEMQQSAERVARGAAYMDENYPGWERKINLSVLDITDGEVCICGQAVTSQLIPQGFTRVCNDFVSKFADRGANMLWEHGFIEGKDGDAWVTLIKERFDTGLLSDAMDFTATREKVASE